MEAIADCNNIQELFISWRNKKPRLGAKASLGDGMSDRLTIRRPEIGAASAIGIKTWQSFFTWVRVGLTKPEATGDWLRIRISD